MFFIDCLSFSNYNKKWTDFRCHGYRWRSVKLRGVSLYDAAESDHKSDEKNVFLELCGTVCIVQYKYCITTWYWAPTVYSGTLYTHTIVHNDLLVEPASCLLVPLVLVYHHHHSPPTTTSTFSCPHPCSPHFFLFALPSHLTHTSLPGRITHCLPYALFTQLDSLYSL